MAIDRDTQELREKSTDGRDGHVKTVFHGERWQFQGFSESVLAGKEREPNLEKFVGGMARPELGAQEKREHDTGKACDVGGTRVFLFSRKLLTYAALVSGCGSDIHSNSKMGGSVSFETFTVSRECKLDEIAWRKTDKEVAAGAINVGAGRGSGVTFEADHSHVGRDSPRNPAAELWRLWSSSRSPFRKDQIAGSGRTRIE